MGMAKKFGSLRFCPLLDQTKSAIEKISIGVSDKLYIFHDGKLTQLNSNTRVE